MFLTPQIRQSRAYESDSACEVCTDLKVCLFIRKIEGKVSDKLLDTIWTTIYQLIYLCYDTGEDFMTQFERNKTALLEIIQETKKELGDVT